MRSLVLAVAMLGALAGSAGADTTMRSPDGSRTIEVPDEHVEDAKRRGWTVEGLSTQTIVIIVLGSLVGTMILTSIVWTRMRRPRPVTLGAPAPGERLYAPDGSIAVVPVPSVEYALRDGYRRIPKVDMRAPTGAHVLIDEDQVPAARAQGYWPMTPSEVAALRQR